MSLPHSHLPCASLTPVPVGRIHRLLKRGNYAQRIGSGAPVYLAAVLECESPTPCLHKSTAHRQTSRPRSSSSPVTPPETTRSRVSCPDTCSSPSETTRSSTSCSAPSSSPRVVFCRTSSPSSSPPRPPRRARRPRRTCKQLHWQLAWSMWDQMGGPRRFGSGRFDGVFLLRFR